MLLLYAVVLAITTPKDDLNYVSRLQEICDPETNKPYFKTLSFGYSCEACSKKRSPDRCPHVYAKMPKHKDEANNLMAERLLGEASKTELEGVALPVDEYVFRRYVNDLKVTPPHLLFQNDVEMIWTYVDPEQGGDHSLFAIASVATDNITNEKVLLSADHYQNTRRGDDVDNKKSLLIRHLHQLCFNFPQLSKLTGVIVLMIESQGGTDCSTMYYKFVRDWAHRNGVSQRIFFLCTSKKHQLPGISVNDIVKQQWTDLFIKTLSFNKFKVSNEFKKLSSDPLQTINHLYDQMNRYKKIIPIIRDPQLQEPKRAKFGAKEGGSFDDVITCVLGAIRGSYMMIYDNAELFNLVRRKGITRF
jgi:hypothetical protein